MELIYGLELWKVLGIQNLLRSAKLVKVIDATNSTVHILHSYSQFAGKW